MGLIEPFAIAATVPSGVLPLGSSLLLTASLIGVLGVASIGIIWSAMPRRPRSERTLQLVHSTAG
jgi:hypothetical protein